MCSQPETDITNLSVCAKPRTGTQAPRVLAIELVPDGRGAFLWSYAASSWLGALGEVFRPGCRDYSAPTRLALALVPASGGDGGTRLSPRSVRDRRGARGERGSRAGETGRRTTLPSRRVGEYAFVLVSELELLRQRVQHMLHCSLGA